MATEIKVQTGANYLLTPVTQAEFLTPEQFDEEQRLIRDTAREFFEREVLPKADDIQHQEPGLMPGLVKKAGEKGLLSVDIPEEYGGADLGLIVSTIVAAEQKEGSFAVAMGAQTTIGLLPIVYYGTHEQKEQYLPRLATGELISAYCLTEPGNGSDAMGIKTRATLSEDGKHYILNGGKQWISNGGFANVYIVFAKVDDTKHTAFIVERDWPGVSTGAEEKKMGIKGSSTVSVYFDNVKVPVENVLGEVGKGHKIAFNILNIGRLKLGAGGAASCLGALALATPYTSERKAFGKPLNSFGMIKKKLAHMASDAYAAESLAYRTVGMVEVARRHAGEDHQAQLTAIEEYAIEAAIAKVFGTEATARCVDEGVQIFGGYGFMQEYPIERAYRDARITRIFEGTNEINRLLSVGTLFRRAMGGRIDLMPAYGAAEAEVKSGQASEFATDDTPADLRDAVNALERAKRASIYTVTKGALKFMAAMEQEEEFMEYAADLLIDLYATDSALARALMAHRAGDPNAQVHTKLAQLTLWRFFTNMRANLERVLQAIATGDELRAELAQVRAYLGDYDLNAVALQREIAALVVDKGGYPLVA
ncbi:MAG TPA: acyl-CoA dehydrogenase family protein [Ktedonobacterales bacterium]|nr:acyl-CoA dehydrogenase family protein [Ktedonobacterales bacterium]